MDDLKLPGTLVSTDWLEQHFLNPKIKIIDATIPKVGMSPPSAENIVMGIPGAVFMDLKKDFSDPDSILPNTIPSEAHLRESSNKLGLTPQDSIVIYDRHGVYSSPRAWWILLRLGFRNVAILDGGFPAWEKASFPTAPLSTPIPITGESINLTPQYYANTMDVKNAIDQPNTVTIDARSEGRFNATVAEPRAGLRGGHIPNSKSLPYNKVFDEQGKMLSPGALNNLFIDLGASPDKELIFTCGSGITACVIGFAAHQAGLQNFKVYDGSWTEWASDHSNPVES